MDHQQDTISAVFKEHNYTKKSPKRSRPRKIEGTKSPRKILPEKWYLSSGILSQHYKMVKIDNQEPTGDLTVVTKHWFCTLCQTFFEEFTHFMNHLYLPDDAEETVRLYRCCSCRMVLHCETKFRVHVLEHVGKEVHSCDVCGKIFPTQSFLDQHVVSHSEDGRFKCFMCSEELPTKCLFQRHVDEHVSNRFWYSWKSEPAKEEGCENETETEENPLQEEPRDDEVRPFMVDDENFVENFWIVKSDSD